MCEDGRSLPLRREAILPHLISTLTRWTLELGRTTAAAFTLRPDAFGGLDAGTAVRALSLAVWRDAADATDAADAAATTAATSTALMSASSSRPALDADDDGCDARRLRAHGTRAAALPLPPRRSETNACDGYHELSRNARLSL